jgi:hypothetical protein
VHLSRKHANTSRTIADCMFSAWGIFIGVSVTEIPTIWKQRNFFLFYVCYCFSMSTVFQAFFVFYLVEPGYEKGIETFEELQYLASKFGTESETRFPCSLEGDVPDISAVSLLPRGVRY